MTNGNSFHNGALQEYPPIENHGLIGDLQTAALISTDGTIDWMCMPRFDSPSIFASLLDKDHGGHFRIKPTGEGIVTRQMYLPGTAILITRYMCEAGVGEVIDFMPITGDIATDKHRLIRLVHIVRGEMTFEFECAPRFDYGRETPVIERTESGGIFRGTSMTLAVSALGATRSDPATNVTFEDGTIRATRTLQEGAMGGVVIESNPGDSPQHYTQETVKAIFEQTRDFWRDWIGRSTYKGRWREEVERSAITLKLMTYAPTGALVAAPTAGLPEQVGGERNWDYRFTWIRDASFSVYALLSLGYTEEATKFMGWLADRARDANGDAGELRIMYRIDGSPDLNEEVLEHLAGYRESRPVRIGNGASGQLQLDIYGEAMDSIYLADMNRIPITHEGWEHISSIVDWLCENWDRADEGIWETRGGQQDFTYGRLMSWVAFDRAIRIAARRARPADLVKWRNTRDEVYKQIMRRAWHPERHAFVQHYRTDVLDASLLYMPLVGFISPMDPMWQSTLNEMDKELVSDSLVYRYNPEASPDGLQGSEGTFSICTFWYVDALARSGRLEDARLTFDKMMTYANHLGLFSEEIGPSGEQLGNFPQAFSHLALITAAVNLDYQLDHGAGTTKLAPEFAAAGER